MAGHLKRLAKSTRSEHTLPHMNNKSLRGTICAVLGAITFGLNPFFGIPLYREGLEPLSVLFYRFALGALMLGVLLLLSGRKLHLQRRYLLPTMGAGALLALTCLCWFMTFKIMDSGIGATLIFIYPIVVTLMMWGLYGERPSGKTLIGTGLALLGVALTCTPGEESRVCTRGLIYITLSAFTYALYIVAVRKSRLRELSSDKLTFYSLFFAIPVFLAALRGGYDLQLLPNHRALGFALGLAFFPSLLSFLFTTIAIRHIGPTRTSVLGALEPLTAVLIGVLCFGEHMSLRLACGTGIILLAVTLVILAGTPKENSFTDLS